MSKKVFKNSTYYMIASFLPTVVGFLMLPIYSRYLTPTDYGVVALVLSLQAFLPLIMTLQIHSSIARFYFDYKNNKYKLNIFISTILLITFILATTILILLLIYLNEIISFVFPKTIGYNNIFYIGILTSYVVVFNSVFIAMIRVQQKAKLFMKASSFLFFISLFINILEIVVYERGVYGVVEAALLSACINCIIYFLLVKEFFVFKIDFKMIIEPLMYSLPLIPHSLSGLIFMYSDRIILERYVTLSAIGLYMFSDKVAMVFKILVNEFNSAFSPFFIEKSKQSKELAKKEVQKISLIFIYFTSMLMVIVALFSAELVYFLLDDKYFDTWKMIPLLSSAYIFRSLYCFSSSGLFFEKQTGKVAIITIVSGLVNIGLNLWLIPKYGVIVAIYTTIFSFFLTFIMAELMSYQVYYLQLNLKNNLLILIYLFCSILISINLNESFKDFGYVEYLYKLFVILVGLFIGYRLNILNPKKLLLRIKG
ncbi:MAG: oligosaccharide flippase family protein [Candidatus Gracilibacteria bacterium]